MANGSALSAFNATEILARTIYGEARGEGKVGMEAVASVILNRASNPNRWPNDVRDVCLERKQFSCWNLTDPNREKLLTVTAKDSGFRLALDTAERAVAGLLDDPTGGADHYHEKSIIPGWVKGQTPTAKIGRHVFYRLAR
jgi:N-acetylmuramoyl-L-alanine amidase